MIRAALKRCFLHLEAWFDLAFGPRWNPLYHLGALCFFNYWIITASGIYVYIFFDTGTTEAYESLQYLTYEQWYLGGVMRSLHRYASDATVVTMLVHMLREFANGRFRGPRWFTWTTGVPILAFVFISGITGYWLVWDRLAQYVAIVSSEWFDWLGIFGRPIARNFLTPASLDDRFFTLLMFIHIAVPLLLLLVLWIHLQRISRPDINPNRGLAVGTFAMLLGLSFLKPAVSQAPADLGTVPTSVGLDWFYLLPYPFMEQLSYGAVWGFTVAVTLMLLVLPWLPPRWRKRPAVVHLESCNGCSRCADDCPYQAIEMRPRSDALPFDREAVVDGSLCVSCGICAGACPTATPFRKIGPLVPGIELADSSISALRDRLHDAARGLGQRPRVMVFGCDHGVSLDRLASPGIAFVRQPCIAAFPPSFIDYVLSRDIADGVVITGCRDGGCQYRKGIEWTGARIERRRDPHLRRRVPRDRILVLWASDRDRRSLIAAIEAFAQRLQTMAGTGAAAAPATEERAFEDALEPHG